MSNLLQISCISTGKGNTLALFPGHIHGIIPVCSMQAHFVMLSHVKESAEILQKDMLQNSSIIHFRIVCFLPVTIAAVPLLVMIGSAF